MTIYQGVGASFRPKIGLRAILAEFEGEMTLRQGEASHNVLGHVVPMEQEVFMAQTAHAPIEGHCLCKAVTFRCEAAPNWTSYCHCESCRRAASSPVVAWTSVPRTALTFTGKAPTYFMSSPGVRRGFCKTCGSPLTYETERLPHEVHLYTALFTNPTEHVPTSHVYVAEQLPWFEVADDLPRYAGRGAADEKPIRNGAHQR